MAEALATIEDLEAVTGQTFLGDPTREARVNRLLQMASASVRRYTGQFFTLVEDDPFEVTADSAGRYRLPQRPVISVDGLTVVDGAAITAASFNSDGLLVGTWGLPVQWQDVGWPGYGWALSGLYTHGYAPEDMPEDVVAVVCSAVNRQITNPSGDRSETLADYAVVHAIPNSGNAVGLKLSDSEKEDLRLFKRPRSATRMRAGL
jgi:hypothetical protein